MDWLSSGKAQKAHVSLNKYSSQFLSIVIEIEENKQELECQVGNFSKAMTMFVLNVLMKGHRGRGKFSSVV